MRKIAFAITILAVALTLTACKKTSTTTQTPTQAKQDATAFASPKKAAHYESNTPEHGSTLAGVPVNVVINFNFDLVKPSNISITKDGKEYAVGETSIDDNKLTLRRNMDQTAPDGIHTVNYKACWPDGSCHDGSFQFKINRTGSSSYEDMTGKTEVTIDMKAIMFEPKNIKVSKGAKVTWTNSDSVAHYVNTDSHPGHTYELNMNSEVLQSGDSYSYTFTEVGIYPYHCSAHTTTMAANILVE